MWQLGKGQDAPFIAADYILLDEYQDTAEVFVDVLQQQRHALLVLVGDDNQRIYEWRGAVNAGDCFPDAEVSMLSQSFRFGQAIADVANSILSTLDEPTELVMKGLPSKPGSGLPYLPSRVARVDNPRCVLCRSNAGAVSTVLLALKEGKKPHLVGGGADVVAFVKAARDLQKGLGTDHPELCCFTSWNEVVEYATSDEGEDLRLMVRLIKEFTVEAILSALENMPREEDADLVVSTAHKSKGREWATVKLAPDFPTINKMQDSDRRLLYVAATRAQEQLDITECPPFCGGYDKNGGGEEGEANWIPGLVINYTTPMPTEEELEAYRASRKEKVKQSVPSPALPSVSTQNGNSAASYSNGTPPQKGTQSLQAGEFTWANIKDGWRVRGPKGMEGQRVTVTRKNGTTSQATLKKVVHQAGDLYFYEV